MKRRSFRALLQVQSLPRGLSLHHLVDFSFRRGDHEGTPDVADMRRRMRTSESFSEIILNQNLNHNHYQEHRSKLHDVPLRTCTFPSQQDPGRASFRDLLHPIDWYHFPIDIQQDRTTITIHFIDLISSDHLDCIRFSRLRHRAACPLPHN